MRLWPDLSRARVQRLVAEGHALVDGRPARASARLRGGERLEVVLPPPPPSGLLAEDLPLAVLHEDADLLVLDKAPGMVVHPARGAPSGTVVNALLHRLRGGAPGGDRPGLAHRLDRETSGCLVVAKREAALAALQAAFKARAVEKTYLALCHGVPAATGRLDTPYGRHPTDRTRFTSRGRGARRAVTAWTVLERYGDRAALLEVALETGRTHQIRVHLQSIGHPVVGDPVYGAEGPRRISGPARGLAERLAAAVPRQALHAALLVFQHPVSGRRMSFRSEWPSDLVPALQLVAGQVDPPRCLTYLGFYRASDE